MADMIIYEPGDWVRFYQNAKLVIGEVRYTKPRMMETELCTDAGSVFASDVLEVRSGATLTE